MNFSIPKLLVSAAFLVVFTAMTVYADPISLIGISQGNFNGGPTSINPTLGTTSFRQPALEFHGQLFNKTVTPGNAPEQVRVGTFELRPTSIFDFDGATFNLVLTFIAPAGGPGAGQVYTANLSGSVAIDFVTSSVTIDFNNAAQLFAYTGGTFSVSVDDLTVPAINLLARNNNLNFPFASVFANFGATADGVNPNAQVPEPLSVMLLGSGLAGLALKLRRRPSLDRTKRRHARLHRKNSQIQPYSQHNS